MGDFAEEQAMEIEALTAMFEEGKEFLKVSDTEFKLVLVPHPQGEEENHVGITLHITYTATYPEVAPEWAIEDVKGLPDPKLKTLKGVVEQNIEENLGMVMIYTVAEACQDFLKENNVKELSMHEEMLLRAKGEGGEEEAGEGGDEDDDEEYDEFAPGKEEEEWKGLAEKPVVPEKDRITPDAFAEWKLKFDQELIEKGILKRDEIKAKTGRQIFMEANKDEKDGDKKATNDDKKEENGSTLVYNAELFGELEDDDVDLDDLSDGED
jgi:hypothetical protein